MATKSVGTLSAKLLLDTKGWTGGFVGANKTADKFSKTMATQVGSAVAKTALKFIAVEKIMRAMGRAFRATVKNFQEIEKSGGVGLDKFQVGRVIAANKAVRELGASLQAIGDNAAAAIAPVVTVFANGINTTIENFKLLGITTQSFSDVILKAAFAWHVGFQVFNATILLTNDLLNVIKKSAGDFALSASSAWLTGFRLVNTELQVTVELLKQADATRRFLMGDKTAAVEAAGSALRIGVLQSQAAALLKQATATIATGAAGFAVGLGVPGLKIADVFSGKDISGVFAEFVKGLGIGATPAAAAAKSRSHGTQTAHERGTLGAVQAVQALGGDAIRSVDENTARMLEQIKGLRTDLKSGRKIVQAKI
jgi:hypothetical protein